jgi:hypothetical protein
MRLYNGSKFVIPLRGLGFRRGHRQHRFDRIGQHDKFRDLLLRDIACLTMGGKIGHGVETTQVARMGAHILQAFAYDVLDLALGGDDVADIREAIGRPLCQRGIGFAARHSRQRLGRGAGRLPELRN